VRRAAPLLAAAAALLALAACVDGPAARSHPSTGRKLAVRTIVNKTQQFGLEDTLATAVRDEFLRDGRYPLVPEGEADDVAAITLTRYLLTPLAYDVTLAPITYKLRITADVRMLERASNRELWLEKDLEGSLTYPAANLAGGQSEDQARATIWTVLAPMIVSRAADGFNVAISTPEAK
jgi:hypothetical protein